MTDMKVASVPAMPSQPDGATNPHNAAVSVDLNRVELYINRELSLLEFNSRVLELAKDERVPLLERLNFLCISCSNLDEFFEVRVAALTQRAELPSTPADFDAVSPHDTLNLIGHRAQALVAEQYRVLNEILLPALDAQGIRIVRRTALTAKQKAWLRRYFDEQLQPILSPMGLDPAHPFPRIMNKSLNFIIALSGKDAFGRDIEMAILQAPRSLPRLVQLPPHETDSDAHEFVLLSSVIQEYIEELFHGVRVHGCHRFRVTRNSDLDVEEEEIDDLLLAVEGELTTRNFGDEVRLEVTNNCPNDLVDFLLKQFGLTRDRLYRVDGPVNLSRLRQIYDEVDRPDLKYAPFTPACPAQLAPGKDLFEAIAKHDYLLHHPYESFNPVVELLRQAALDPHVLTIKQTLYRTGSESPIVAELLRAARAGKEVTVVVELLARFDEKDNISLATRLQEAGVQVVYGIVGYKTHAKMLSILRREGRHLRYYTHLGTGNYHPRTARLYTDYGLLTADREIGEDVRRIFVQLTGLGKVGRLHRLLQSPFTLHSTLMERIQREIDNHHQGRPAFIRIKVNAVVEPMLIHALYRASMAGVAVHLIVRGMCCLRPGMPDISETIEVRSIVGRFLEHSRVYIFENGGEPEVILSSADVMSRNMFRRLEVGFPIHNQKLAGRIRADFDLYWSDTCQAWALNRDGHYRPLGNPECNGVNAQFTLLDATRRYTG